MSLNWVMLPAQPQSTTNPFSTSTASSDPPAYGSESSQLPFIPLPNERTIYTSSPRTSFSLTTSKSAYPAQTGTNPVNHQSDSGILYLTTQRLIYLPHVPKTEFKSFSCPVLNLHDSHLVMPWFGPNSWTAVVEPVNGGGLLPLDIPASLRPAAIELKLTFKEGGAPEFEERFVKIRERVGQAVEQAIMTNGGSRRNVDYSAVHVDELPRYEDSGGDVLASNPGT